MNFINSFITLIEQRKVEVAVSLVEGNVVNFETYQRLVGQHQGLQEALQILNNLLDEDKRNVDQ